MKKTIKPFATTFKNYGTIIVPIGVAVTSQTAMGVDTDYHFVNAFAWVRRDYPEIANILIHDLRYYGLNVPEEFLGPDENPVPFIPETDVVNYSVGPDGRVLYAGLSYAAHKVAVEQYMKINGIEDVVIAENHILLHGFKFDTDGTNCSIDVIGFTSERRGEYWFNHYNERFDNADNIDVTIDAYKYSNPSVDHANKVFEREGCIGDLVEFIVPVEFQETCGVIEVVDAYTKIPQTDELERLRNLENCVRSLYLEIPCEMNEEWKEYTKQFVKF